MAETSTILDLNSMMASNATLDNIEEAPDYNNPPAGAYRIRSEKLEIKDREVAAKDGVPAHKAQYIRTTYSVVQTKELSVQEPPVADGTLFSENFQGTEQGLSFFKKRAREVLNVETVDSVPLSAIFDAMTGAEFDARLTYRTSPNPKDPTKPYVNLNIQVVPPAAS